MIEYIRGTLSELTPTTATLEAGGVGYLLGISLTTYTTLQPFMGREAKLYVFESIREDAYLLFGFASRAERSMFELLITVSGVGGNTARTVLSAFTPDELARVITTDDARALKAVKGIGLKTAQRIIVDLKDKMGALPAVDLPMPATGSSLSALRDEAVAALQALGFKPDASQRVVSDLLKTHATESVSVEEIIKLALKSL